MFGIDLALLGVILAAVAIPVAIAVPVVLYIREGHAKIKVSDEFDKTGFVEVVIAKRGRGETQIDSVELMRAGTNTKLPLNARSKTGPIEFAGGKAKVRVYFKLVGGSSKDEAIEALVGHAEKPLRVKITWTTRNIFPQERSPRRGLIAMRIGVTANVGGDPRRSAVFRRSSSWPTFPPRSITDWGYAECLVPQRLSGVITSQ
jgi:hypothetical protein